jgi:hypothetical protein
MLNSELVRLLIWAAQNFTVSVNFTRMMPAMADLLGLEDRRVLVMFFLGWLVSFPLQAITIEQSLSAVSLSRFSCILGSKT